MSKAAFRFLILAGCLCIWLPWSTLGQDPATNAAPAAGVNSATTEGADDSLRAYLRIQEQMHETLLAIERNRQQAEETSAQSSNALAQRLELIEQSLSAQRASELQAVQHANRTMVLVVSGFAALGCLAVLLTAYFQWRAVNRFTAISSALALGNGADSWRMWSALDDGKGPRGRIGPGDASSARLLDAIERLEKRIQELEGASRAALNEPAGADNIVELDSDAKASADPRGEAAGSNNRDIASLMTKGQVLLNASRPEEAIAVLDEVLAAEPRNAEALVKKGTALEQLRKPQEAIECYDQAIAADGSLTIAYLYKGGLFNRLERFTEALACYEQALHTQERRRNGTRSDGESLSETNK